MSSSKIPMSSLSLCGHHRHWTSSVLVLKRTSCPRPTWTWLRSFSWPPHGRIEMKTVLRHPVPSCPTYPLVKITCLNRIHQITSVTLIMLTSLVPSSHWVWIFRLNSEYEEGARDISKIWVPVVICSFRQFFLKDFFIFFENDEFRNHGINFGQ